MNLLAIDTAITTVSVTVVAGDVRRSFEGIEPRRHTESLAPAIARLCTELGLAPQDLDAIAVDVGPGLFNSLRVGVATAKGLAQATGVGCLAISSLAALARRAFDSTETDRVAVLLDARRSMVFVALFDRAGVEYPLAPPLCPPTEAIAAIGAAAEAGPMVVCGDGAQRYGDALAGAGVERLDLLEPRSEEVADLALAQLAGGAAAVGAGALVVDYRRPADVRIGWEQRPS